MTIGKHTRRHHYVPRFYLTGFTPSGREDERLWAHDKETGKKWPARPDSTAFEKDFYRIEAPDIAPDALEKELADLEGRAAPVLRSLAATHEFPGPEEYAALMEFVAFLVVRVPHSRDLVSLLGSAIAEDFLRELLSSREQFEESLSRFKSEYHELDASTISYDRMKRDLDEGVYEIRLRQNLQIGLMIHGAGTVRDLLWRRRWSLIVADDGAGQFVTSDNPVSLSWATDDPPAGPPGLGVPKTEVKIPLTRNKALLGRFEGQSRIILASAETVALVNAQQTAFARRFVYSPREDFPCDREGRVGSGREYVEEWTRRCSEA